MYIAPLTQFSRRELAHRLTGGLEVTLYWHPHDNSTSIDVHQMATDETISFPVPPDRALDAFHHPFAHLASKGTNDEQIGRSGFDATSRGHAPVGPAEH